MNRNVVDSACSETCPERRPQAGNLPQRPHGADASPAGPLRKQRAWADLLHGRTFYAVTSGTTFVASIGQNRRARKLSRHGGHSRLVKVDLALPIPPAIRFVLGIARVGNLDGGVLDGRDVHSLPDCPACLCGKTVLAVQLRRGGGSGTAGALPSSALSTITLPGPGLGLPSGQRWPVVKRAHRSSVTRDFTKQADKTGELVNGKAPAPKQV